ncbi:30S ribosomal protein S17e [Sulfolobales archaeon HS-7]|nr:30S ribosomal protein S17e [Sulfolobales archaeon HS-7]
MGNIYTNDIKRIAQKIYEEHKAEVTKKFEDNKKLVSKYLITPSKKVRNRVAGYLTRYAKVAESLANREIKYEEEDNG